MGTQRISVLQAQPATTFWMEADVVETDTVNRRWKVRVYMGCKNGPGGTTLSRFDNSGQHSGTVAGVVVYNRIADPFLPAGVGNNVTRWYQGPYDRWVNANGEGYPSSGVNPNRISLSMGMYYGNVSQAASGFLTVNRIVTAPPPPEIIGFDQITATTARLRFSSTGSGGSPVTRWEYRWATVANMVGATEPIVSTGTSTMTDLPRYSRIYVQFRGINAIGTGAWSSVVQFSTLSTVPDKMPPVIISAVTTTSISYQAVNPPFIGAGPFTRNVELYAETGTFPLQTMTNPAATAVFGNLSRGTNYRIRHRLINSIGAGEWSDLQPVKTSVLPPSTLMGYNPYDIASTSVWSGAGSLADNGGEVPSNIRVELNTAQSSIGSVTVETGFFGSFPITGLPHDTTMYYRLSAGNSAGWGPVGAWQPFKTKNNVPFHALNLEFDDITDTSASASWSAPANLLGSTLLTYKLKLGMNKAVTQNTKIYDLVPTELSQALSPLAPATTYYVYLYSASSNGVGSTTAIKSFTTTGEGETPKRWWKRITGVWRRGIWWKRINGVWRRGIWWKRINGVWRRS